MMTSTTIMMTMTVTATTVVVEVVVEEQQWVELVRGQVGQRQVLPRAVEAARRVVVLRRRTVVLRQRPARVRARASGRSDPRCMWTWTNQGLEVGAALRDPAIAALAVRIVSGSCFSLFVTCRLCPHGDGFQAEGMPSSGSTPRRELHTKLMLSLLSKAHMSEPVVEPPEKPKRRRRGGILLGDSPWWSRCPIK
jgi:hypothetical protein